MDEIMVNGFLIEKWKWSLYVIKTYLVHGLYLVYVVEAFIALKLKSLV